MKRKTELVKVAPQTPARERAKIDKELVSSINSPDVSNCHRVKVGSCTFFPKSEARKKELLKRLGGVENV